MPDVLLALERLSGGYGHNLVLRAIDLTIHKSELVAIIGPNGHGKSTLLRAISGLLPERRGTVRMNGADISRCPAHRMIQHGIAHIPQGDLLFAQMSVEDNLLMGAYTKTRVQAEHTLEEVYAVFPALTQRRAQIVASLSGGERRMVGIGRGLMADSELLVVDEPSLGLAQVVIDEIYAVLTNLKRAGRSILIVEENPARIVDIADRIHLIDDGAIIWSGSGADLFDHPELIKTYLGEVVA